uniref:Uncharacterized protein n=1 Tax=Romanomermis culicivorax TaxID=13658 RepID=A0A915KLM6_ROMCU
MKEIPHAQKTKGTGKNSNTIKYFLEVLVPHPKIFDPTLSAPTGQAYHRYAEHFKLLVISSIRPKKQCYQKITVLQTQNWLLGCLVDRSVS